MTRHFVFALALCVMLSLHSLSSAHTQESGESFFNGALLHQEREEFYQAKRLYLKAVPLLAQTRNQEKLAVAYSSLGYNCTNTW